MLLETDLNGRALQRVPVANHHGDLCFHEDQVYVAVNLGNSNQPPGQADSWIFVYDAGTLLNTRDIPSPSWCMARAGWRIAKGNSLWWGACPRTPPKTTFTSMTGSSNSKNGTP